MPSILAQLAKSLTQRAMPKGANKASSSSSLTSCNLSDMNIVVVNNISNPLAWKAIAHKIFPKSEKKLEAEREEK